MGRSAEGVGRIGTFTASAERRRRARRGVAASAIVPLGTVSRSTSIGGRSTRPTTPCGHEGRRGACRPDRPASRLRRRARRACPGRRPSSGAPCRRRAPARARRRAPARAARPPRSSRPTRSRSRTLPFTCTTISTSSSTRSAGSATGQAVPQPPFAEHAPELLRHVRRVGLDQRDRGLGREAGGRVVGMPLDLVDELHHGGDRRVEREPAVDVVGHLRDRVVRLARQRAVARIARGRRPPARARCARAG